MATTYTLISSNTLSSNAASVTFSSIPATYTDLVLRISARTSRAAVFDLINTNFNGDTASNYSNLWMSGNATTASSGNYSSAVTSEMGGIDGDTATANTFSSSEIYIPSYAAVQNKSFSSISMMENNVTSGGNGIRMYALANLWRNTAAISSILLVPQVGPNFLSTSSFYLYGIKSS